MEILYYEFIIILRIPIFVGCIKPRKLRTQLTSITTPTIAWHPRIYNFSPNHDYFRLQRIFVTLYINVLIAVNPRTYVTMTIDIHEFKYMLIILSIHVNSYKLNISLFFT